MSGSDEPSGQQQVIQNSEPWAEQKPYLTKGFERAEQFLDQPVEYYPGSTVVDFSNQTEQALQQKEALAQSSPIIQHSGDMLAKTARGDFLDAGNPHLQSAFNAAAAPITDQYMKAVAPGVDSTFAMSGRTGSPAHYSASQDAQTNLARELTNLGGTMAYQNYGDGRDRQMQAAQMAPSAEMARYLPADMLQQVGGARERQAGAVLQDDINRYTHAQNAERDALTRFMATVGGGSFGGSTSSQQPIYSNDFASGLGMAATGVGIADTLFGKGGLFV